MEIPTKQCALVRNDNVVRCPVFPLQIPNLYSSCVNRYAQFLLSPGAPGVCAFFLPAPVEHVSALLQHNGRKKLPLTGADRTGFYFAPAGPFFAAAFRQEKGAVQYPVFLRWRGGKKTDEICIFIHYFRIPFISWDSPVITHIFRQFPENYQKVRFLRKMKF